MAIENSYRKYNMSDAQLCMFTSNLCNTLTLDLTDLAVFGVTAPKIATLKQLGDDFEAFTTDIVYLSNVVGSTEAKNIIFASIKETIRDMALRCQIKWGSKSFQLKSLGITGLNTFTDDTLLMAARRVHSQMTSFLLDLTAEGLTQGMLDDFEDEIEDAEIAMNTQKNNINERDEKTFARVTMGNELYDLVTKYCDIGKRVYAMSNPAKYDDYVIYTNTSPGSLNKPLNFMFDTINYLFTWLNVENATSYELQSSSDGINYDVYWTGNNLACIYEEDPNTTMYFRVRARNDNGFGPFSSVIEYNFAPILLAPLNFDYDNNSYTFSWDEVENAANYEFQYRQEGNMNWMSFNVGNDTEFLHSDPVGSYVARVRAMNGSNYGHWSVDLQYTVIGGNSY